MKAWQERACSLMYGLPGIAERLARGSGDSNVHPFVRYQCLDPTRDHLLQIALANVVVGALVSSSLVRSSLAALTPWSVGAPTCTSVCAKGAGSLATSCGLSITLN